MKDVLGYQNYPVWGLIVGSLLGLATDAYGLAPFGAVGLGIVFFPIVGLLLGSIAQSFSQNAKARNDAKS